MTGKYKIKYDNEVNIVERNIFGQIFNFTSCLYRPHYNIHNDKGSRFIVLL